MRLDDCQVPDELQAFQRLDYFDPDGWYQLLKSIETGIERLGLPVPKQLQSQLTEATQQRKPRWFGRRNLLLLLTGLAAMVLFSIVVVAIKNNMIESNDTSSPTAPPLVNNAVSPQVDAATRYALSETPQHGPGLISTPGLTPTAVVSPTSTWTSFPELTNTIIDPINRTTC